MATWNFTKLSDKHLRCIDAYFINGRNKTQALIAAGYKESSARENGWAWFNNKAVITEVKKREVELANQFKITREWVVERLANIANSGRIMAKFRKVDDNGQIYLDFRGASQSDLAVIADLSVEEYKKGRGPGSADIVKTKLTVQSPQSALDSLARILGFNQDKIIVEGDDSMVQQLQAGRARVHKLRHPPRDIIDAEFSEIAQKQLDAPKEEPVEEPYESFDEKPAVEVWDEDTIPW
jgi:phage terminase small subunit